jgi:MerR family copper efflux transcriptional regulator
MTERAGLMTVGDLAARTGLSIKMIRELEGRGLIYTAGRSPANYRLFDDSALWCVEMIRGLRSLGLTFKEIEQLAIIYMQRSDEPVGPHLEELLERVERRMGEQIDELDRLRARLRAFRARHASELAGGGDRGLAGGDPRRPAGRS